MFVSHTAGKVADTGLAAEGSELTMVDVATLRRIAVASSGSRGDVVHATSDGRLLISQSNQVDVVSPVTIPTVVATNPPSGAQVALPQRSEEHTSELQSLMRSSYAVFCLKKKNKTL